MNYIAQCERFVQRRLREDAEADSFVYFLKAKETGQIKIGKANDVSRRLASLSCASPQELELLGVMRGGHFTESWIHLKLRDSRVRGEWFLDTPALRSILADNSVARQEA